MQSSLIGPEGSGPARLRPTRAAADRNRSWLSAAGLRLIFLVLLSAFALPGCQGCRTDADDKDKKAEEDEKEEEEKPKPDFESGSVYFLPAGSSREDNAARSALKPGHWGVLAQDMRANNFDFVGQLYVAPSDSADHELELERTPYQLALRRPISLPKGQARRASSLFFMPRPRDMNTSNAFLRVELRTQGGGRTVQQVPSAIGATMPDHQYYMVVMAGRPNDYGYLGALNVVQAPSGDIIGRDMSLYRVMRPDVSRNSPLPDHPLAWTSIAYLVLDDFDPAVITPRQQQSLLDWLHWGGQIIVSGPRTLDRLRGTFLADYLPVEGGSSRELTAGDFAELNDYWSLNPRAQRSGENEQPADATATLLVKDGVDLKLREGGQWLPHTGELVAEGRVGRGRIVVTSFALSNRNIAEYWISRESFFNGALLRHPARNFSETSNLSSTFTWVGENRGFAFDPRIMSNLRYMSRDLGLAHGSLIMGPPDLGPNENDYQERTGYASRQYYGYAPQEPEPENWTEYVERQNDPSRPGYDAASARQNNRPGSNAVLDHQGWATSAHSGVAGWNDFSAVSNAARNTLTEGAGIKVPSGKFVAQVLLGYLLVLVPANWLIFRLIGRVELAWVAAPLIAIVGTVVVVRVAQLDIGFARSRTDIGILELQPGYDRGHLTSYIGLYTSLSSTFSLDSDPESADGDDMVLLPFSADPGQGQQQMARSLVSLSRDENVELSGLKILSASTGMVHAEEMITLGGPLELATDAAGGTVLENNTRLALRDVGIIRRQNGQVDVAWIGDLPAGESRAVSYEAPAEEGSLLAQWDASPVMSGNTSDEETMNLRQLLDLAADPRRLREGDVRLVGWYGDELVGLTISPHTSQNTFRTLVVANLAYGDLPEPNPDRNLQVRVEDPFQESEETEPRDFRVP